MALIGPCVATGSVSVTPSSLQFMESAGAGVPPEQKITLRTYSADEPAGFTVSTFSHWLSVQPLSGVIAVNSPKDLTVTANPANLPTGTYFGSVVINCGTSQPALTVEVTLVVGSGGAGTGFGGGLTADPQSLTVDARSEPVTALVQVYGDASPVLSARATTLSGGNWLSVAPAQRLGGAISLSLTPGLKRLRYAALTMNPVGVPVGRHFGRVEFDTNLGTLIFPVTFNVARTGPGNVRVSTQLLDFSGKEDGTGALTESVTVTSPSGSTGFLVEFPADKSWLSVLPSGSKTPATLKVKADPEGVKPGLYSAIITILGSDGYSQQAVQVNLTVLPKNFSVSPESMVFSAAAGAAAPPRTLTVSYTDLQLKEFKIWVSTSSGGPWLNATPNSSKTPGTIKVTASAAGLGPGTYSGKVLVDTDEGTVQVPVRLIVPPGADPVPALEPPAVEAMGGCPFDSCRCERGGVHLGRSGRASIHSHLRRRRPVDTSGAA